MHLYFECTYFKRMDPRFNIEIEEEESKRYKENGVNITYRHSNWCFHLHWTIMGHPG